GGVLALGEGDRAALLEVGGRGAAATVRASITTIGGAGRKGCGGGGDPAGGENCAARGGRARCASRHNGTPLFTRDICGQSHNTPDQALTCISAFDHPGSARSTAASPSVGRTDRLDP